MSATTFNTGVCRSCEHKWDLEKVYGLAELQANLNNGSRLAICPECKHSGVSFPIHEGEAPKVAKVVVAKRPDPKIDPEAPEFLRKLAEDEGVGLHRLSTPPEDLEKTDVLLEPFQPEK